MNRKWLLAGVAGAAVAAGACAFVLLPSRSPAGPSSPADAPAGRAEALPVSRVVLFSSGVGHFLREGNVEGDARVDLAFPVQDVNDLLKSMVLLDQDGGQVRAAVPAAPVGAAVACPSSGLPGHPGPHPGLHRQAEGRRRPGKRPPCADRL